MCGNWKTSSNGRPSCCWEHISERELPERFAPARGDALTDALTTDCPTLEDVERAVILKTLKRFGGNKTEAAKALGITRKTLHAKLSKYQSAQEDAPEGEDEDKGRGNELVYDSFYG